MNFFELYLAVTLAMVTSQAIGILITRWWFNNTLNSWLESDEEPSCSN